MQRKKLDQIYRTYYREIYLYAFSLCRDPHEAEELVSDTFYQALLSFDGRDEAVKYWLFRVCKNLFLDRVRERARHPVLVLDEETGRGVGADFLEQMIGQEETGRLYREILKLPAACREAVYLFYFMDYSIKEISHETGRPEGAVKTALCRARARLKQTMGKEDGSDDI